MINRIQIASLAIPVDISENEYHNTNGLLQKINEYRITPVYNCTRLVKNRLLLNDDVLGMSFIPEHSLFVVRTTLSLEALEELLSGLVDGDFNVLPLADFEG